MTKLGDTAGRAAVAGYRTAPRNRHHPSTRVGTRSQGNEVTHAIALRDGWIELRYTGVVDYAARMAALDDTATLVRDTGIRRILADYTQAALGDASDSASRQDYLSKAISAAVLEEADVALIGLPPDHARAAELAGVVRNMRVRHFEDEASALAWLLSPT